MSRLFDGPALDLEPIAARCRKDGFVTHEERRAVLPHGYKTALLADLIAEIARQEEDLPPVRTP